MEGTILSQFVMKMYRKIVIEIQQLNETITNCIILIVTFKEIGGLF